jgi:hypothetical protein
VTFPLLWGSYINRTSSFAFSYAILIPCVAITHPLAEDNSVHMVTDSTTLFPGGCDYGTRVKSINYDAGIARVSREVLDELQV